MSIKSEIEMASYVLVKKFNQSEFNKAELRSALKDMLGVRHKRVSVHREFNQMLQEKQYAIRINERGNVEVKKSPNNLERFFIDSIINTVNRITITRIEITM